MALSLPVPVIDLFAGPGGLGEGFAALRCGGRHVFEIALSIEKDRFAHATLELRALFRELRRRGAASDYYRYVRGLNSPRGIDRQTLFSLHPEEAARARQQAWCLELCRENRDRVSARIRDVLKQYPSSAPWVLLGGPPCQAYSIAGRSRMRPVMGARFDEDKRHTLYEEYLAILAEHRPHLFVMENVKGLLSSQLRAKRIFDLILADLRNAAGPDSYTLMPLVKRRGTREAASGLYQTADLPRDGFLIHCEKYGIPQARHRVIILGIRSDLLARRSDFRPLRLREGRTFVPVEDVLEGLPPLRSGLTRVKDSPTAWKDALQSVPCAAWLRELETIGDIELVRKISSVVERISPPPADRGGRFLPYESVSVRYQPRWYLDPRLQGVCNHEARPHMPADLHRYLFAACYAAVHGLTPKLGLWPRELLPAHANVLRALRNGMFNDRFRVQLRGRPATTITCHLARDGHYAIHFDPFQCRSLTVREAARIQTFPDNYFFEGPRTRQYVQVGNAVPPLLARHLAAIVFRTLSALC